MAVLRDSQPGHGRDPVRLRLWKSRRRTASSSRRTALRIRRSARHHDAGPPSSALRSSILCRRSSTERHGRSSASMGGSTVASSRTASHFPVSSVASATDCAGLSVTMPCKQAVMPLLDAIDPSRECGRRGQYGCSVLGRSRAASIPTWRVSPRLFAAHVRSRGVRLPCECSDPWCPRHGFVCTRRAWRAGDHDVDCRCAPLRRARIGCCCSIASGCRHRTGSVVRRRGRVAGGARG